jgi:hypothetical protein
LIRAVGDSTEVVSKAAQRSLHTLVGQEVDSVAQGAPPAERVEALKAWWRTARVRLRTAPTAGGERVETAARDVLQTIATMKGAPAPAKEAAPAGAPAAEKPKAAPAKEAAPAPATETKAAAKEAKPAAEAKAAPAPEAKAAPAPEAKAAPAPEPKPAPEGQAASADKPAEPAPAEGGAEFESMFQESEGGDDASAEGYETLLGEKE